MIFFRDFICKRIFSIEYTRALRIEYTRALRTEYKNSRK